MVWKRTETALKIDKNLMVRLRRSTKALAIPMTFLILLVSMIIMTSVTYYFSVEKISSGTSALKITAAKQDMLSFSESIQQILWQPGASCTLEFSDSGGKLNVQPLNNSLVLQISDGQTISGTIFNQTVGQVAYGLPYSQSIDLGDYLKGDSRTITNQSGSIVTQLKIDNGEDNAEIQLRYRPTLSYITTGIENDKDVTNIRIYIVNLNSSQEISLYGKLPVKATCIDAQITTLSYSTDYEVETLTLTSTLNDKTGQVNVPISSTIQGAIINLEIAECNIQIERCLV